MNTVQIIKQDDRFVIGKTKQGYCLIEKVTGDARYMSAKNARFWIKNILNAQ